MFTKILVAQDGSNGSALGSVAQRLGHVAHQPVLLVPESAGVSKSLDRPATAAVGG
jgi:hypothetical protein